MSPIPSRRWIPRLTRVLFAAGVAVASVIGLSAPALADSGDDGEVLAPTLPLAAAVLIYLGLPLLIVGTIWVLASLPTTISSPRYRPGLSWWAAPVWFNGPDSQTAISPSQTAQAIVGTVEGGSDLGGAHARW